MKGFRWSTGALLITLLIALLAAPVAAVPVNAAPKTNQEHEAWLVLAPLPETTEATEITLSGKMAGKFTVTVTNGTFSTTLVNPGQFSIAVPLTPGENVILLTGDNGHGRLLNAEVRINRKSGENPVPRSLSASISGPLVADGQSRATATVAAVNADGGTATDFSGPISIASSDPSVVAVSPTTVNAVGGTAIFILMAGTNPGAATLTVTAPGLSPTTFPVTVTPVPDSGAELAFALSLSGALKVGDPEQALLTVTVIDANGKVVTNYADALTVTSSDPEVVSIAQPSATPVKGIASFALNSGTRHGEVALTVSAPGIPESAVAISVAQPDVRLTCLLEGTLQVDYPAPARLTVSVLNAKDQVYAGFAGTISVATSDPNIVQVSRTSIAAVAGIATVELTSWKVAGTANVTVSAAGMDPVSIPVTVQPAPAPVLGLVLAVNGSLEAYSQSQATITATVVDTTTGKAYGKYTNAISFTSSNTNSVRLLTTSVVPVNGVATATLASGNSYAPATITVTAPGMAPASVVITPRPPTPTQILLGVEGALVVGGESRSTVTATVLDAAGQVARSFTGPVTFSSDNPGSVLVVNISVTPINGVATTTLAPGAQAGTATVTASASGLPAAGIVVTTEAPRPPHLSLLLSGNLVANNQSQASLAVTVLDATGAVDRTFASPINFVGSNPEAVQVLTPVVTPANGVAMVTLKAGSLASASTITATAPGLEDSSITVTPVAQVPSHLTLVADPTFLFLGGNYTGKLHLGLRDQTGTAMLRLTTPLRVQLTTSNEYVAHFGNDQSSLTVTMTGPSLDVTLYGGIEPGETVITGSALNAPLTVDRVFVRGDFVPSPDALLIETAPVVTVGSPQVATVIILDAYGDPMSDPSASAVVKVTRHNPDGTTEILGTIQVSNGVGTLTFTTVMPGGYRLTAESVGGWPLTTGETTYTAIQS